MTRRLVPVSRGALLVAIAAAFAAIGADCDGDVLTDPTFRDWCSDGGAETLCSWTVDSGSIQRVPTWNENDFGVSFTTTGTQISQVTGENQAACLLFTTVADIDPSAQMSIAVDFDNDGTIDFQAPLGASDWHKVQAEIPTPPEYDGITFHIRKGGTGAAVLAEMRVVSTTGCTPLPIPPGRLGEPCGDVDGAACTQGLVCSKQNLCVQCNSEIACANGAACQDQVSQAFVCGPGQHLGQTGDPCVLDTDCASNGCDGADLSSLAAVFKVTDAGCSTAAPGCDVDASLDGGELAACACIFSHGGTCR